MAGAELIHHGEPEEGQRRSGFQRPGLHQIFQQRTGNQTAFFLAVLAQIETLQLGGDGAFQRVEGGEDSGADVRTGSARHRRQRGDTGRHAIQAAEAFSYIALPGQPAVVAALDHAVELGGHEVNHGGEL